MYPIKHVVSIVIKAKKEFKITFDGSHEEVGGVGADRRDENIRYDNKSDTKEINSCSGGVGSQTDEPSTAPHQLPTNKLSSPTSSSSSSSLPQSASANRSNSRSKQQHHHQNRNKMPSTVTSTRVGADRRHEYMRYDNISDAKSTSVETRWNRERKPYDNSSTVNDDHHGDDDLNDTDDIVVDNDASDSSIEYKEEIDDNDDDDMAIGVSENDPDNVENVRYHYRKGTFRNDNVTKVNITQPMSSSTTSNISTGTAGTVGVSLRKELYCKVLSPQDRVEWCETILKLGRCSSSKTIHSNIDFY
jgi:hypothetical protein